MSSNYLKYENYCKIRSIFKEKERLKNDPNIPITALTEILKFLYDITKSKYPKFNYPAFNDLSRKKNELVKEISSVPEIQQLISTPYVIEQIFLIYITDKNKRQRVPKRKNRVLNAKEILQTLPVNGEEPQAEDLEIPKCPF